MSIGATFLHLPREDVIFLLIFPYLDVLDTWSFRLVSKECYRLCEEYFANFCFSVSYNEVQVMPVSAKLNRRAIIVRILRACKNLKKLTLCLSGSRETEDVLKSSHLLMSAVNNLQSSCGLLQLKLAKINTSFGDVTTVWRKLGENCHQLQELHIEEVSPFDDNSLDQLTNQSTSLTSLALISLPLIRGRHFHKLATTCSHLTSLNLAGCSNIEKGCIQRVLRCCHSLRYLDLNFLFGAVDDHTILTVREFCPQLVSLSIRQCSKVTSHHLSQLRKKGVEINVEKTDNQSLIDNNYLKIWGQV